MTMNRGFLFIAVLSVAMGCGEGASSSKDFAEACVTFCENRFDCFGDPEGRRASCPSACSTPAPPGACRDAATVWANCLAALTCTQLDEINAPETYCGTQHAAYEAACEMTPDGGVR